MNSYQCLACNSNQNHYLFTKNSRFDKPFSLHRCTKCGSEFISPLPDENRLKAYYEKSYFTTRTDRGYDNYFSNEIKTEIERVFTMNLNDLGFFNDSSLRENELQSLDIGCAAGYFVNYMKTLGWSAYGIDVSEICTDFASNRLQLNVVHGDYLEHKYTNKFNLVTMWATIEHLPRPDLFIQKIHEDLDNNGIVYISTCRCDSLFKKVAGKRWRYYNVPEHIHYFTLKGLTTLLEDNGFTVTTSFSYGSGFGKPGSRVRLLADYIAKRCNTGDMLVIGAQKRDEKATL
jgi:2-polyprenyl-3-methyl-5-hydroxy-6-metoxy-1,4-benzoquinol methylase